MLPKRLCGSHLPVRHNAVRPVGPAPSAVEALPKDGDRVRMTGVVHVLKGEAPRDDRILAIVIQILESN